MGNAIGIVYGLVCLAVGVGLILAARPRYGKSPGFLSNWVVGQIYVLVVLVIAVVGVALIVGSLPTLL
jgi:hypothetical protein